MGSRSAMDPAGRSRMAGIFEWRGGKEIGGKRGGENGRLSFGRKGGPEGGGAGRADVGSGCIR